MSSLIESGEEAENKAGEFEQEVDFDDNEEVNNEIVVGDEIPLLLVRRACFTPRKVEGED